VHDILYQFHQQFPVLAHHKIEELSNALHRISDVVFTPALQRDYLARAWLLRWQQAIDPYLNAQTKMELEGWHFKSGELPFELRLTDDLTLHGRIDRVDGSNQAMRVLDYKMIDAGRLRDKLKDPGEDVQLACYAAAGGSHSAAYISFDKDKVQIIEPPHDLDDLVQANMDRLIAVFGQMQSGVALPANGIEKVCQYCEIRGLCRKPEWSMGGERGNEHG
ncbi:MAG: PD-(D/E)XK nuclease family protein, partial [Candidatus Nitrotoga sp.]